MNHVGMHPAHAIRGDEPGVGRSAAATTRKITRPAAPHPTSKNRICTLVFLGQ